MPRTSRASWASADGGAESVFVAALVTALSRGVIALRRRPRHHFAMNSNDIRVTRLPRLLDVTSARQSAWVWLTAAVLVHLVVSIVHGAAHSEAHVPLSRAASLFVFAVIVAGPLVGLALAWPAERIGTWVIAITMASALVFGCVNHFVLAGPDHVSQVAEQWRPMFTTTAGLLAAIEGLASVLAVGIARRRKSAS